MHLKHFTNEFNTSYAQKTDKKTDAQLGKTIQLSTTESSCSTPSSAPHTPQCRAACSKTLLLSIRGPKCDENGNIPQFHIPNAPTVWLPQPLASGAMTCCHEEGDSAAR